MTNSQPQHLSQTVTTNRPGFSTSPAGDLQRMSTRNRVEDSREVFGGRQSDPDDRVATEVFEVTREEAVADRVPEITHDGNDILGNTMQIRDEVPAARSMPPETRGEADSADGRTTPRATQEQRRDNHLPPGPRRHRKIAAQSSRAGQQMLEQEGEVRSSKKTCAHLKLVSENIRGRSSARIAGNFKWKSIAEDMRANKIGVMALQETHLTEEHVDDLNRFHSHIKVWNTAMEDNPSGSGGVSLVFNKLLTNVNTVEVHEIVPGRAILATWEWHRGDKLIVMAVYAPTDRSKNEKFWTQVKKKVQETRGKFPKPDVVLGDFNMVEDEIDRFPAKLNPIDDPDSFRRPSQARKNGRGGTEAAQ
ncbi:hypothetical protein AURDEDRAFT_127705 [Auricularia subglabra TFB-10046 SS5]|nr:hypothetical protein AURDEDRAFT_127705 [Auricularia subglabra TFB-10046 SS5]